MNHQKNLLLAITGSSPAVVTETLYGINKREDAWPDEIRIITTSYGEKKAWEGLAEQGHLAGLCHLLDKPLIPFSREDILVVPDAQGKAVDDARTEADQDALANFIMKQVRDLTTENDVSIHASIAGGRKTMTFYLGYAMSLFGRPHDCLSHVLITDGYEGNPDFYYPTCEDFWIERFDGQKLNAREAVVTLTDIPFIRQRSLMPDLLKKVKEDLDFRVLANLINLGEQPERLLFEVYTAEQRIVIFSNPPKEHVTEINISSRLHWAFYLLILEDSMQKESLRGNYTRPKSAEPDDTLLTELVMKLDTMMGLALKGGNGRDMLKALLEDNSFWAKEGKLHQSLQLLYDKNGFSAADFSSYLTYLRKPIEDHLPKNLAARLIPRPLYDPEESDGSDKAQENSADKKKKNRKSSEKLQGRAYGIDLPNPEQQIHLIN